MGRTNNRNSYFNNGWLLEEDYKLWIEKVPTDISSARCSVCRKTFSLSNMGKNALDSHRKSTKHMAAVTAKRIDLVNEKSQYSTIRGFFEPVTSCESTVTSRGDRG